MFGKRADNPLQPAEIDEERLKEMILAHKKIPHHIAFIMDGNGRWAKKRGLPRIAGHRQGVNTVRRMVEVGPDIGVKVMTFYAFSAENWRRPLLEVNALMDLLVESINRELEDMMRNEVCVRIIGDLDSLPEKPRRAFQRAVAETASNRRLILVLAISYSGRQEIVRAVRRMTEAGITDASEADFAEHLDTAGLPDPDLLIRTSGEFRLSNFLLYQLAYTEIIISERFWPEFRQRDLFEAVLNFQQRDRRFGGIPGDPAR